MSLTKVTYAMIEDGDLNPRDYGAVGDGITNDTVALKNWLAAMQATGRSGFLIEGRYLVTPGELVWTFDNSPTVANPGPAGPTIYTCGLPRLVSDGTVDAPLLSINNDPANGLRFVQGGYIGPLAFEDTSTGGTENNRHGLQLYGVNSMVFGTMVATDGLRGHLIYLKPNGTVLTGDGWHIYGCNFEGAIFWNAPGYYAFKSDVLSQFFNYSTIGYLWGSFCAGAFQGAGAALNIKGISVGYTSGGYAVDIVPSQSNIQSMEIGFMELDSPEYALSISGVQNIKIGSCRVIPRKDVVTGPVAWPKKALRLYASEPGQVITNLQMNMVHRLFDIPSDADLTADYIDYGNDGNFSNINIDHSVASFFTPTISKFRANVNGLAQNISSKFDTRPIIKQANPQANIVIVRCSSAAGQTKTTYDGSEPVTYASEQADPNNCFSSTVFTAPATGLYFLRALHLTQPNGGDLVRLGFFLNSNATPIREHNGIVPDGLGAGETFPVEVQAIHPLTVGDTIKVCLYETRQRDLLAGAAGLESNNYFECYLI